MPKGKASRKGKKTNALESLTSDEAHEILMRLARDDPAVASRAEELALALVTDTDAEGIVGDVLSELELLEVEDVWDSSGETRDSYVDPNDRAWQMFEDALEPIREEMRRLQRLGKQEAAREYCEGLLRGLWRFDREGRTEFKDWAADAPHGSFGDVLEEWEKGCKDPLARKAMTALVDREFPDWAR